METENGVKAKVARIIGVELKYQTFLRQRRKKTLGSTPKLNNKTLGRRQEGRGVKERWKTRAQVQEATKYRTHYETTADIKGRLRIKKGERPNQMKARRETGKYSDRILILHTYWVSGSRKRGRAMLHDGQLRSLRTEGTTVQGCRRD